MLASVVFNNPQNLLTVQAAETTSEAEDESQYETETEESEEEAETQESEDVIESDIEVETYLEEEFDGIQDEEDSSDTYTEEEEAQESTVTTEEESSHGRSATGSVEINETNFPDSIFREYVKVRFDADGDDELSENELDAVTEIDVTYKGVSNLEGIEYFTVLESLLCGNNSLTSLNVSNNPTLEYLSCEWNALTSLEVSNNPALEYLHCDYNALTSLDVSNSPVLEYLIKEYGEELEADYLQMGHHGYGGLCDEFYTLANPKAAYFDAPAFLMEDESGKYDNPKNAKFMESIGSEVFSFKTAPNKIILK